MIFIKSVGIGLGKGTPLQCLEKSLRNHKAVKRWLECKCLVIDEISMVSADLFGILDFIARSIRKSQLPFGGIQLVLCGDFFQLPPIKPKNSIKPARLCFESYLWKEAIQFCVELEKVHRQNDDNYVDFLCQLRKGDLTREAGSEFLRSLCRPIEESENAVTLYPLRVDAKLHNISRLDRLQGDVVTHTAKDDGALEKINKECTAQRVLKLKVGARVMLLYNRSNTLVNGLMGYVISYAYGSPVVQFDNGEVQHLTPFTFRVCDERGVTIATRTQIPLDLAYAVTIHKSQGMTIKKTRLSLARLFEPGQGYTALSRCPSPNDIEVINFDNSLFSKQPRNSVLKFYRENISPVNAVKELPAYRDLTPCRVTLEDVIKGNGVPDSNSPSDDESTDIPVDFENLNYLSNQIIEKILKDILESDLITAAQKQN